MLDTALEAAVRLGKNFRIIARLGAMLTPPVFSSGDTSDFWNTDLDLLNSEAKAHAPLTRYNIEQFPVIPTFRLGFILNY